MTKEKNVKNVLRSGVGFVLGVAVYLLIKFVVFPDPTFDKEMVNAASAINETCPMMIDGDTQLDNVVALPDNVWQYNYTLVNYVIDSIDVEVLEEGMYPLILNNIKTNPDLALFRDHEVTMNYCYKDMNGVFLTKLSFTAKEYLEGNDL